jgi:hypothetical protein
MKEPSDILDPFVVKARHLSTALNMIASDMIRNRDLAKKLKDEPEYFRTNYPIDNDEYEALRTHDLPALFKLGLHPFLLVRFAGMMGILEYWQALDAPGRGGWPRNH